jgi:hypothetical protein
LRAGSGFTVDVHPGSSHGDVSVWSPKTSPRKPRVNNLLRVHI